jgi:hypothetical protein
MHHPAKMERTGDQAKLANQRGGMPYQQPERQNQQVMKKEEWKPHTTMP